MPPGRELRRRAARLSCVLVLAAILHPQASSAGAVREVRRVLILNVFDPLSSPGVAELDHGIIAGLESSPYQIELYSEDLEMTLFPDEAHQREFREWYTHKYHDRKPDVVIAVGLEPIRFMALSHRVSFPDTPIVFCGSTEEMLGQLKLDSDFTGVWGAAQPEKTLLAALHLQPGTKHVVVVGGVGAHDRYLETVARESFRKYESRFDFLYLTDLDMPALLERLKHLPDDTIVYHTSLMQDASGARFIDATQSVPLIASASKAPVFIVDDVDLGRGTAGGDVLSWASDGRVVGEMAVKVLNGEKPQDIPIAKSADVYMFDWRALKRWGLNESALPPGSIVLNRQTTIWESYKWYIVAGTVLVLAETVLILGLMWQRERRRRSESQLRESEERFRLAAQAGKMYAYEWDVATDVILRSGDVPGVLGSTGEASLTRQQLLAGVHPDDRPSFNASVSERTPENHETQIVYRVLRPDRSIVWLEKTGRAYFDEYGRMVRMIGMVADITERRRAETTLVDVNRRLIEAQEQERVRIGRELHDDVTQRLAMLLLELEQLQGNPSEVESRVGKLRNQTSELLDDVEALSHELHGSKVRYLGAVAGIGSWCREFGARQNMEIDFRSDVAGVVPSEIGVCLFRVLQEALHNAVKHSGVKRVEVRLMEESNQVHLIVSDSGKGFDVESTMLGKGVGLMSMQERVRLVNGTIAVDSKPMGGTTIEVRVPLESQYVSQSAS